MLKFNQLFSFEHIFYGVFDRGFKTFCFIEILVDTKCSLRNTFVSFIAVVEVRFKPQVIRSLDCQP